MVAVNEELWSEVELKVKLNLVALGRDVDIREVFLDLQINP